MRFEDFLKEETSNSSLVVDEVLEDMGVGLETVRQTQSAENTKTSIFKIDGHNVEALWVMDDGIMKDEGYSESDAKDKLQTLIDGFVNRGGKASKVGSLDSDTLIKFDDFNISIEPFTINSSLDGRGSNRTYLRVLVK